MTTALLPNICFFTSPPPARPLVDDIQAALIAAGFSAASTTGTGAYCKTLAITPPGQPRKTISPGNGVPDGLRYDVNSLVEIVRDTKAS